MMKTVKYILSFLSIIILISLTIPFFISVDSYKSIIAAQVKENTGRDLKIDGDITLAILPVPQIKIAKVKLSSLPGARSENLIDVDMIEAKLALKPLFSGQIVVSSIDLKSPIINLEKMQNGKGTWEIASASAGNASAKDSGQQSTNSVDSALTINNINIKNAKLKYVERENVITIDNLDLDVVIPSSGGPIVFYLDTSLAAVNLNKLSSSSTGGHSGGGTSVRSQSGRWSKDKIDLSILSKANGTINITIPKLTAGSMMLDKLAIKAKLNSGVLTINSFTAGLFGGNLKGEGSISANSSKPLIANISLNNASMRNIAPEGGKIKIIGGTIDFSCNLQSDGGSLFDYVSNLRGNINLNGNNGKISGFDLQKITQALNKPRDLVELGQNLESAASKGETNFSRLSAEASVNKGIIKISKCEIDSNETSVITTGQINLPQYSLDAVATIKSGVKNFPPISVHLYGSIDNPQHKIDVKAIWKYLAKNALTGVIENLKQGKTNPKDLINGLLGGGSRSEASERNEEQGSANEGKPDPAKQLIEKGLKGLFK